MPQTTAMFERMMISSSMGNILSYTWLKRFDASEFHRLVQTLQMTGIGWFNRKTIENVANFPRATRLFLQITSQFINVFKQLGNVFFTCSHFPYKDSVTNEWFTLPDDEIDRKRPVKVINVDKDCKKSTCY